MTSDGITAVLAEGQLAAGNNGTVADRAGAEDVAPALVAVPDDMVDALLGSGLAVPLPVFRGAVLDAAVIVGTDAATVVTLLQAPDAVRRFAGWLHDHLVRRGDSIKVQGRRQGRTLSLRVDGSVSIDVITDFIAEVLADRDGDDPQAGKGPAEPPGPRRPAAGDDGA